MIGSRILYLSPLCTVMVTGVSGCCSLPARSEPVILTPLQRAREAKGNAWKLILSGCKAFIIQTWRIPGLSRSNGTTRHALTRRCPKSGYTTANCSPIPATQTVTASPALLTAPCDDPSWLNLILTSQSLPQVWVLPDCQEAGRGSTAHHSTGVLETAKWKGLRPSSKSQLSPKPSLKRVPYRMQAFH